MIMFLQQQCDELNMQLNEFISELEILSKRVDEEMAVSVTCNIEKGYMKCERISLSFKIVGNSFIFTENINAIIKVPLSVMISMRRDSECLQSQAVMEKPFQSGDIITVSGKYAGEFYLDIIFN